MARARNGASETRISTLGAILKPTLVRVWLVVLGLLATYDTMASQFELPTVRALWGMSGSLMPWWGWLLVLQAILTYALFEYVRRTTQSAERPLASDGRTLTERLNKIETTLRQIGADQERLLGLEAELRRLPSSPEATEAPPLPPSQPGSGSVTLTAKEKRQAKNILVDLADLVRDKWVPLFDSGRWLHQAQDVYLTHLHTLPDLKAQANRVLREIQGFQGQHEHMLSILGLNLDELAQAAAKVEGPIQTYIGKVGAIRERSDTAIQLLQRLAQPVRDAFAHYDMLISALRRTVTRTRKEIDA